jgi:hypothetical protein
MTPLDFSTLSDTQINAAVAEATKELRAQLQEAQQYNYAIDLAAETHRHETTKAQLAEAQEELKSRAKDNLAAIAMGEDILSLRAQLEKQEKLRLSYKACHNRDAKEKSQLRALLAQAEAALREAQVNVVDLLLLAKSWSMVWGDKLSPESLELFWKIESKILSQQPPAKPAGGTPKSQ